MNIRFSEPKGVVVFHSGYGHTKRVAEAIAEGAKAIRTVAASIAPLITRAC
ncbi:hypothetical protein [Silvimonas iriomotensis]|uniref:hypothetical protein n=1 Tax=Silvimonas iriomotensis TaxID=449662 RepID=UPI001E28D447|nr:hypothetical protein [Silvimonas iriomotensis]